MSPDLRQTESAVPPEQIDQEVPARADHPRNRTQQRAVFLLVYLHQRSAGGDALLDRFLRTQLSQLRLLPIRLPRELLRIAVDPRRRGATVHYVTLIELHVDRVVHERIGSSGPVNAGVLVNLQRLGLPG